MCANPNALRFRFLFDFDKAYDKARDKGLPVQACEALGSTVYKFPFVVNLVASFVCAVKRSHRPVGAKPARSLSLRPEAIGAGVEVMKCLKPPTQRLLQGVRERAGPNVSKC